MGNWIKTDRYSLGDRSCVHATIELVRSILPENACELNENIQFPFPKNSFNEIVQIGEQTTLGQELNPKEVKRIQDRIHYLVDRMEAKKEKDGCDSKRHHH